MIMLQTPSGGRESTARPTARFYSDHRPKPNWNLDRTRPNQVAFQVTARIRLGHKFRSRIPTKHPRKAKQLAREETLRVRPASTTQTIQSGRTCHRLRFVRVLAALLGDKHCRPSAGRPNQLSRWPRLRSTRSGTTKMVPVATMKPVLAG